MAQLVLLVVAAAWAAVLIPPMLRSRVENRPNSSVTDFRRQLKTLQTTATPPRGSLRPLGRPLAPSTGSRRKPARTHQGATPSTPHHRQASLRHTTTTERRPRASAGADPGRYRIHGDARGGEPHWDHRQTHMQRGHAAPAVAADPRGHVRRRRSNVLFLLVITTACTLFLAATTSNQVLLYVFALSFLALCGYVYLLAQLRQREHDEWSDGWLERH